MESMNFYEIKKLAEERIERRKSVIQQLTFLILLFIILLTCYNIIF